MDAPHGGGAPRPGPGALVAALVVCLLAGGLYAVQVRSGFQPVDHALELTRPESFVVPGTGAVGPSPVGLLRWQGDAPLHLRLPGLGPPARLRLKLLPECPGEILELRADDRLLGQLHLAASWTLYEVAPTIAGDELVLSWSDGASPCPLHLSAVRTTTVVRQSSDLPRYWIVRTEPGSHPAPPGGMAPWLAAGLLLASAGGAAAAGRVRLATWLRVVAPGVALLAMAEAATRAADLRLVYPPLSFPVLVLVPGLLYLAWRHRRALLERARPPATTAVRAVRARPALVLGGLTFVLWAWILSSAADRSFGGDLRGLVHFGPRFGTADPFPGAPTSGTSGYDGQFYAVLATDPFLTRPETLERLDTPSFRANRILIPMAAWVLAFGRSGAAVWTYMGLCWLLTLATVPLVARWLEEEGTSGWWAGLLLLNAGLAVSVLRVTLDGAALFLLLAALHEHRRERTTGAALAASAAALTREVFLLGGFAMAGVEALRRRWKRAAILGLSPLLALGLWRLRVVAVTESTAKPLTRIFALPFRWIPVKLGQLGELHRSAPEWFWAEVAGLAALALGVAAALRLLPRVGRNAVALTLLGFSGLALVLSHDVYEVIDGYARILVAIPVLCLVLSGGVELSRRMRWWLRGVALLATVAGYFVVEMAV